MTCQQATYLPPSMLNLAPIWSGLSPLAISLGPPSHRGIDRRLSTIARAVWSSMHQKLVGGSTCRYVLGPELDLSLDFISQTILRGCHSLKRPARPLSLWNGQALSNFTTLFQHFCSINPARPSSWVRNWESPPIPKRPLTSRRSAFGGSSGDASGRPPWPLAWHI